MANKLSDDGTVEESLGPTPNGGVRSVAYYRDRGGNPCHKDRAVAMEIVEFDFDDVVVGRTYMMDSRLQQPLGGE